MKKHLVNLWYQLPDGRNFNFKGTVPAKIGDSGKAICHPIFIFKAKFGFDLPPHSTVMQS